MVSSTSPQCLWEGKLMFCDWLVGYCFTLDSKSTVVFLGLSWAGEQASLTSLLVIVI